LPKKTAGWKDSSRKDWVPRRRSHPECRPGAPLSTKREEGNLELFSHGEGRRLSKDPLWEFRLSRDKQRGA